MAKRSAEALTLSIGVRLSAADGERLRELAEATNRDLSQVVRSLLRAAKVKSPDLEVELAVAGEAR